MTITRTGSNDLHLCFSGFTFIDGGVECTTSMVTTLDSVPSDVGSITCALIPDALARQMESEFSRLSLCLLGLSDCTNVEGEGTVTVVFWPEQVVLFSDLE